MHLPSSEKAPGRRRERSEQALRRRRQQSLMALDAYLAVIRKNMRWRWPRRTERSC